LVLFAHLRRWWSLSGRDGFGARWDSTLFMKVKRLFPTTPVAEFFSKPSWIETEANGGHWGDRTRSQHVRTRPVSNNSCLVRGLGFTTGASGHSWDRRVRSGARGTTNVKGRSDAVARPVTIDRTRQVASGCLLESTGCWHCASGQFEQCVRSGFSAREPLATGR
jgi:hypothetical protein